MIHIGKFVQSYEQSIIDSNLRSEDLRRRISQLASNARLEQSCRLQARLRRYEYLLNASNSADDRCWQDAVVRPVYEIIHKRLGKSYVGELHHLSSRRVRLQFFKRDVPVATGLSIELVLKSICTEPQSEKVELEVVRSTLPVARVSKAAVVPLETTISELISSLDAA